MSHSRSVTLSASDPLWPEKAAMLARSVEDALGPSLLACHHIGSTSVPGLLAKPILDLLGVVNALDAMDSRRATLEGRGWEWRGENGIAGRRYLTRDTANGERMAHLHIFADGAPEITRHLAFRDHLRAHPEMAADYARLKMDCRDRHPDDSLAYSACKSDWIEGAVSAALKAIPPRA